MNGSLDNHPKVGCVFAMVVVSILPHLEFGRNDREEDAPHFGVVEKITVSDKNIQDMIQLLRLSLMI